MSNNSLIVAIVDWHWKGHHPTYFKAFVRALCGLGNRVLALCASPDELMAVAGTECRSGQLEVLSAMWLTSGRIPPGRIRDFVSAGRTFCHLRSILKNWERQKGLKIDMVFFACIYERDFYWFRKFAFLLPWNWTGLYLHARAFHRPEQSIPGTNYRPRPASYLTLSNHCGLGVLDESVIGQIHAVSNKPVVLFPDFAEATLPDHETVQGQDFEKAVSGRPVVSLMGHLHPGKGVATFAEMALRQENRGIIFFLGGEVAWELFSELEQKQIKRLMEQENVYTHLSPIPDEAAFNAFFLKSDVIFAAYLDFPNSSNILTKAAIFEKPVVVSDGYLMANRVRKYGLGAIIPQGDALAATIAVHRLLEQRGSQRARWNDYVRHHSADRLNQAFGELLGL